MPLTLLIAPASEPLTLAEAKAHLRVEHDDDDALITASIAAARAHVEAATRRALITQTWRLVLDAWPADGRIAVALAPIAAVVAARVYDSGNVSHACDAAGFVVTAGSAPGVIAFPPWAVAAPGRRTVGIEIDMLAGYGAQAQDVPPRCARRSASSSPIGTRTAPSRASAARRRCPPPSRPCSRPSACSLCEGETMNDPGRLATRLVLEAPAETPDGAGGVTRTFATVARVWAEVVALTARERVAAAAAGAAVTHRIRLRARADLTLRHRLRRGARIYRLVTLRDEDAAVRFQLVEAEERVE